MNSITEKDVEVLYTKTAFTMKQNKTQKGVHISE